MEKAAGNIIVAITIKKLKMIHEMKMTDFIAALVEKYIVNTALNKKKHRINSIRELKDERYYTRRWFRHKTLSVDKGNF